MVVVRFLHPIYLVLPAAIICRTVALAGDGEVASLPEREWAMIRQIAANNNMTDEQTWFLAAIRRFENGRPGLEFGVGSRSHGKHRACRFHDGFRSFYAQGYWAAGTIIKHFDGDLLKFGKRYCPHSPQHWAKGIHSVLERLKKQNGNRLPGCPQPKRPVPFLNLNSTD